jgi:ribosome-associated toxin RatA of RatAB toxin-antitoxin module
MKYWARTAKLARSTMIREFTSLVIRGQQRFLLDVSIVDPLFQQLVVRWYLDNKKEIRKKGKIR